MKNTNFFRALKKRWWVIALFVAIGFVAASVTQPSSMDKALANPTTLYFSAKNIMLIKAERAVPAVDYGRITLEATTGEVPETFKAAYKVSRMGSVTEAGLSDGKGGSTNGSSKEGGANAARITRAGFATPTSLKFYSPSTGFTTITAAPDRTNGSFVITALSATKESAAKAANLYADKLTEYLSNSAKVDYDKAVADLQRNQTRLEQAVATFGTQLNLVALDPTANSSLLKVKQAVALRAFNENSLTLAAYTASGPNRLNVARLEAASPQRTDITYFKTGSEPASGGMRLAFGASIGLLLAICLIVIVEVVAARVRDVSAIEAAAKLPVLAEVPNVEFDKANRFSLAAIESPASVLAESYRTLRTSLLAMWARHPVNVGRVSATSGGSGTDDSGIPELKVLLVTSPGPAEGKSVTVANLAAVLAETGKSVIVVDADFRRPTLNKYLGGSPTPDLISLGRECTRETVWGALQETKAPGVKLLATTQNHTAPGESVAIVKAVVTIAREFADIIIVDSPPLLLANDSAELSTFADGTLLLARSGWTRRGAITASADLLRRVGAQILGIGLIGAERGARYGGYAGYAGYGYGQKSYYSYGGYGTGTHRSRPREILVKMVPWQSQREARDEAIDLRIEAERDSTTTAASAARSSRQPDPSDDESWLA